MVILILGLHRVAMAEHGERAVHPTQAPVVATVADSHPGLPLTLVEAKRMAVKNNWDQQSAQDDVAIADAQRMIAHEFPNPSLSYSTSKINTDGRGNGTPAGNGLWSRSYDTVLAFTQPFEIGGKRSDRQASAGAGYEAARAQFADARRTLDIAVTRAYVAAALAEATVKLTSDSAGYLRTEANLAAIRFKAGDIGESDLDQIEIAARQFELQAQNARAGAVGQRVALEVLLGVSNPCGDTMLGDELEMLANQAPPVQSGGEINRSDLVAAEQSLRKAEAEMRLQKAMRIPDPALLVQYEHQPPDGPDTVGVGVSLPLPLWSRNHGAIHAATLARDQAALAVGKIKAQIAADIASARASYDEALARWRAYQKDVRPRAERVRESVSLAYEKGGASLLNLLEAQRDDNVVRLAAAQAAADTTVACGVLQAALTEFTPDSSDQP